VAFLYAIDFAFVNKVSPLVALIWTLRAHLQQFQWWTAATFIEMHEGWRWGRNSFRYTKVIPFYGNWVIVLLWRRVTSMEKIGFCRKIFQISTLPEDSEWEEKIDPICFWIELLVNLEIPSLNISFNPDNWTEGGQRLEKAYQLQDGLFSPTGQ